MIRGEQLNNYYTKKIIEYEVVRKYTAAITRISFCTVWMNATFSTQIHVDVFKGV
jgi:hypothetical protein